MCCLTELKLVNVSHQFEQAFYNFSISYPSSLLLLEFEWTPFQYPSQKLIPARYSLLLRKLCLQITELQEVQQFMSYKPARKTIVQFSLHPHHLLNWSLLRTSVCDLINIVYGLITMVEQVPLILRLSQLDFSCYILQMCVPFYNNKMKVKASIVVVRLLLIYFAQIQAQANDCINIIDQPLAEYTFTRNTGSHTIYFQQPNYSSCNFVPASDPDISGDLCSASSIDEVQLNGSVYTPAEGDWQISSQCGSSYGITTDGYSVTFDTDNSGCIAHTSTLNVYYYEHGSFKTDKKISFDVKIDCSSSVDQSSTCSFNDYVTSGSLTGSTQNIARNLGPVQISFDVITSTTDCQCAYTQWDYFYSGFYRNSDIQFSAFYFVEDLVGDTLTIDGKDQIAYGTQYFDMSWYALPTDNPQHSQHPTRSFTLVVYSAITSVTEATTLPASSDVNIGSDSQANELEMIPTFTVAPENLQGNVNWSNYFLSVTDESQVETIIYQDGSATSQSFEFVTVDLALEKLIFATTDVSQSDKTYSFVQKQTYADYAVTFSQEFSQTFSVTFKCIVFASTTLEQGTDSLTYNLFQGELSMVQRTFEMIPACNEIPTENFGWRQDDEANLNGDFTELNQILSFSILNGHYYLTATDYQLHNTYLRIKKRVIYSNTDYKSTHTLTISFVDGCQSTEFITAEISIDDVVSFITVDANYPVEDVLVTLPKLDDSNNQLYGTDPLNSICHTQTVLVTEEGSILSPEYLTISSDYSNYLVSSSDISHSGEHNMEFTYTLTRYTSISTTLKNVVIFYLLEDPNSKIEDQYYTVGQGEMTISLQSFTVTPSSNDITITHEVVMADGSTLPNSIILIENSGKCDIVVSSSDPVAADYKIKVKATAKHISEIQVVRQTQEINLSFLVQETFEGVNAEVVDLNLGEVFPPYFENLSENLVYYNLLDMTSQTIDLGAIRTYNPISIPSLISFEVLPTTDSEFIQFDLETTSLTVDYKSLNENNKFSNQQIEARLTINDDIDPTQGFQSDYVFVFLSYEFQQFTQNINLKELKETEISLQGVFGHSFGSFSDEYIEVKAMPSILSRQFSFDEKTGVLTILQPDKLTNLANSYLVSFHVTKFNQKEQQYTKLMLIFIKLEEISSGSSQVESSLPYFKSAEMDNYGVVKVLFSDDFMVPQLSKLSQETFEIKVKPADDSSDQVEQQRALTWQVSSYKSAFIHLQLTFENPLFVSSNAPEELDTLQITCLEPSLFIRSKDQIKVEQNATINVVIPLQISQGSKESYDQFLSAVDDGSKSVTVATLITNILLSQSLNGIWEAINSLQLMVHMSMFAAQAPINVVMFDEQLQDLVNFDILPTEYIFRILKFSKPENSQSEASDDDSETKDRRLSSKSGIKLEDYHDLTTTFGTYIFLGIAAISSLFIYFVIKPIRTKGRNLAKAYKYLKLALFWNASSRAFLEGYMNLSLGSLMMVLYHVHWDSIQSSIQSVIAYIILILILTLPLYITYYLRKNIEKFRKRTFKEKFSSMLENLNFREKWSSAEISVFCYRRFIQALVIVIFRKRYFFQIQLMTASTVFLIIIAGQLNVLRGKSAKRLNLFNETSLLLHCYIYFLFCNFLPDPQLRFQFGYIVILNTLINFGLNAGLIVLASCAATRRSYARKKHEIKWKRFKKKQFQLKEQMKIEQDKLKLEQELAKQKELQAQAVLAAIQPKRRRLRKPEPKPQRRRLRKEKPDDESSRYMPQTVQALENFKERINSMIADQGKPAHESKLSQIRESENEDGSLYQNSLVDQLSEIQEASLNESGVDRTQLVPETDLDGTFRGLSVVVPNQQFSSDVDSALTRDMNSSKKLQEA